MDRRRVLISLLSVLLLLLITPVEPLSAAPNLADEVVLNNDLTLREGEHIDGDLVIIGGNLTMRVGSRVEGSVTVLGGNVEVDGIVERDLVALGGDVTLGAHAHIRGDTVALGGHVQRSEGAQTGDIIHGLPIRSFRFWRALRLPFSVPLDGSLRPASVVWGSVTAVGIAVSIALLSVAIVHFWPAQTVQVAETILTAPLPSLGVGCLLYPLAASLVFFILITICLAPVVPAVVLLVVAASLFGWVALGTLWGRRLVHWVGWRRATPLATTGAGVFILTIVAAVAGALPCLGIILTLGAASIGLGAVTLSRFGTTPYRPQPPPSPTGT